MWLALQLAGICAVVAGVFLLAGLGWSLIVAGLLAVVIAEVRQ